MATFDLKNLPQIIKVNIQHTAEGNFIAVLPEYDEVFTQAASLEQLDYEINDLIYSFFDVPKEVQSSIYYKKQLSNTEPESISRAQAMIFRKLTLDNSDGYPQVRQ